MIFVTLKTSSCSSELSMIWTPELNSPHTITTSLGSARVLMGSPVQKGLPPLHHSYIIVWTITVHLFISAIKIWERHELLEVTVGYFNEELVSYEMATTLVMVVAFLFPVLSLLEIILYLIYQKKV